MEDRLRGVESDVGTLKEWRTGFVDPHIRKSAKEVDDISDYIIELKAQKKVEDELADTRHQANSFKLNIIMGIIALLGLVFTALMCLFAYQQLRKTSFDFLPSLHGQLSQSVLAERQTATVPNLPGEKP